MNAPWLLWPAVAIRMRVSLILFFALFGYTIGLEFPVLHRMPQ
jgi:hypothetical protein